MSGSKMLSCEDSKMKNTNKLSEPIKNESGNVGRIENKKSVVFKKKRNEKPW